ncbi:MAG: metalloregulator ArsR/SmtB family transcription factor [Pseudomonadota bacterium]|nr:metalloregulator ArsR/SmtB family transcription factor [Pseudomonadota bacterium]
MNKSRARSVSGRPFLALSGKMETACDTLRAMSHETRLKILCLLDEGEMPVNRIADAVGQSVSTVSQHLSKLRSADLVTSRRDGQTILYASSRGIGSAVIQTLCGYYKVPARDD